MAAWQRRPTVPGIYAILSNERKRYPLLAMHLSAERIEAGAPFGAIAVYGPLPQHPCQTCGGLDSPEQATCENCKGTGIEPEVQDRRQLDL